MTRRGIFLFLLFCILALNAYATNYAIVVGINDYRYLMPLAYAEKDAQDVAALLTSRGYNVETLVGFGATKEAIQGLIRYYGKESQKAGNYDNLLFFYFSGHGIGGKRTPKTGIYTIFMDVEDEPYTQEELIEDLKAFKGMKVLFLDACYQGLEKDLARKPEIDMRGAIESRSIDLFIAASSGNEAARDGFLFEGERIKNGVATYLFLRGIERQEADLNRDGTITIGEIGDYFDRMKPSIEGVISQKPEAHYLQTLYRQLLLSGGGQGGQTPTGQRPSQQPASEKGTCLLKIKAGNELAQTGQVTIDGRPAGEWEAGWIFIEDIAKGAYRIGLDGDKIEREEQEITFTKDYEVKEISIEGKKAKRAVKIAIEPRSGSVWIDGVEKGTGIIQEMLEVGGIYRIEGKQKGYATKEETLRVPTKGERIDWTIELEKLYAQTYEIDSEPSGAEIEIEIDGEKKGKGPIKVELEEGTHRITAKKEGYEDGEKTIQVTGILKKDLARTPTTVVRIELKPKTYAIEVSSEPSEGGTVRIDNGNWVTSRGESRGYGSAVRVEAEEKVGYRFEGWYEGTNRVSGNTTYSWAVVGNRTLTARYTAQTGTVRIESAPSGAEVSVNGNYKGTTPYTLTGSSGSYEVEVKKSGYITQKKTVRVVAGQTTPERFALTEIPTPPMVQVNRGSFQMGNVENDSEGWVDEKPVHTVTLTYDFWIGKYEVTFNEYDAYCAATGKAQVSDYSFWAGYNLGRGTRPVIWVSWWDAIGYCNWLSEREGLAKAYDIDGNLLDKSGKVTTDITKVEGYRLPTEAEWEYAARGGQNSRGYKYAGSNDLNEVGWYYGYSGNKTHPVGEKKPNELGLYDMSGNVWEWCHDWWDSGYYSKGAQTNPTGPSSGAYRVVRGGSWYSSARSCRAANRSDFTPSSSSSFLGLRVSRTVF